MANKAKHKKISARQYYIENNPCNIPKDCPNGIPSCGCKYCAKNNGFYAAHEIERIFTSEAAKQIKEKWDEKTGYLGPDGCVLPRKLRSFSCLSWSKEKNGCKFR